ncbi:MAG: hypothetical protein KDD60_01990 [Bdellovibrionales bacterium]|nr:hypothetical protein [Bdellovibrionales bacterium]
MARKESVTQITRRFIFQRPSIRHCLIRGLINHSALARRICEKEEIDQFDAVHAASKRFEQNVKESFDEREQRLLREGQVLIYNQISMLVIRRPRTFDRLLELQKEIRRAGKKCEIVDGVGRVGLVVSSKYLPLLEENFQNFIIRSESELAQIVIQLNERGEAAQGIIAHVMGILAFHGINIVGENCYWGQMSILIHRRDVAKAIEYFGD